MQGIDGPDFAEAFDAAWEDENGELPYVRRRVNGVTEVAINPRYYRQLPPCRLADEQNPCQGTYVCECADVVHVA